MVRCIIHTADIHIRNFLRLEEYSVQLEQFVQKCREIASNYEKDEVRIVIAGDILHQKNTLSPELIVFVTTFIRQLEEIAKVIVIAGNHDLIVNNTTRKDAIGSIFESANFQNAVLLDQLLGYESGYVVDDNITWVLYSIYTDYLRPSFEESKEQYPDNKVIGLFHGPLVGSALDNGTIMDMGCSTDMFDGCDVALCGDIHKRQILKGKDCQIVYPGSLVQQNFGETITSHGFAVWDVENLQCSFVDLENDYSMYKFEIKDFSDIDNDKEALLNY